MKSTTNEGAVEDADKIVRERVESENICPIEGCGAKLRHTCARKLHEISDWEDGGASSISISMCFLRACNVTLRERIERRRGVKLDGIYGNEVLLMEIDTIERSKNIRKGDIAREGDGGRTS